MEQINWAMVGVFVSIAVAWSGGLLFLVKWIVDRSQQANRELLKKIINEVDTQDKSLEKLDRAFMELRADLPRQYVMREDWIRFNGVIDARLETVTEKLNRLLERGVQTQ